MKLLIAALMAFSLTGCSVKHIYHIVEPKNQQDEKDSHSLELHRKRIEDFWEEFIELKKWEARKDGWMQ